MKNTGLIDFVCVIHGNLYSWDYVEKLHSMMRKNLLVPFRFHVFTEDHRSVPDHMIKHSLQEWPGVTGARSAWWYKLQIFDPTRRLQQVLYLDLDTVIVKNLDWVQDLDTNFFWTIHDFKRLWRPNWQGLNSSLMYFDAEKFWYVWQNFQSVGLQNVRQDFKGDQDFLTHIIPVDHRKFIDNHRVKSWRWEVYQGGLDPTNKTYTAPGTSTNIPTATSLVIFHGKPKPHEIVDPVIISYWH